MGTIVDKLNRLLNTKAAIKAAIIAKGQSIADSDPFSGYADKIAAIETGIQLPALTTPGAAEDLLAGKQLIDQDGNILTGTMPEVEQAAPSISVSDDGIITASATQAAGHVAAGTKSATYQMPITKAPVFEDVVATSGGLVGSYYVYTITTAQEIDALLGFGADTDSNPVFVFAYPYPQNGKEIIVGRGTAGSTQTVAFCTVTISGNTVTFKSTSAAGNPGNIATGTICYLPK